MSRTFDQHAGTYGADVQSSIAFSGLSHDFFLRAKALLLQDLLAGREGFTRCLDVGCGVGALHPHLAPLFPAITGVDVSRASVALAAQANPANAYSGYDGDRLPFEDASFDLALTVCVLHHVEPRSWPRFVAEMRRVVRPGGLVVAIEHNPYNPLTRLAVSRCAFDRDAVLLRPVTLRALFAGGGLEAPRAHHFLFLPSLAPTVRRCEALLRGLPFGAQYAMIGTRPRGGA